ncbi:MAG: c-type cytochrome [Mucilaginibacter sp.]
MKKFLKWTAYIVIVVIVVVVAGVSYIMLALPNVGKPEDIKVELTPARIAHGKYLATSVSSCMDCHSPRDWTKFGGPNDTTLYGTGGEHFDKSVGFPGDVIVPNITPYKLKDWTDGELFRTITTGQRKNGTAIFPLMPWPYYSKMDREDIYDIIAYIRTLKPKVTNYPKSSLDFPLNIIVHTMPEKATLGTRPDPKDTLKYGEYMVQSAACKQCHSQDHQGSVIAGLEFAGGHEFTVNGNTLLSANITPDKATGIGTWTQKDFIARFRVFKDESKATHVGATDFQTVMPWWEYSRMSDGDLKAIYAYLHTIKPISNKVEKFTVNSSAAPESSK